MLLAEVGDGADPEHPDEYLPDNAFRVPTEARWQTLQDNAKPPTIGELIDPAMAAIEQDNPRLKGILPKDVGRPALDKHRLGELLDVIGTIGLGDAGNRSKEIPGRDYEDFLTQFASAEGTNGGRFDTPRCVVRLLVEMLAPYKDRVDDPYCGSNGCCNSANTREVAEHGDVLTPGLDIGADEVEDDNAPFAGIRCTKDWRTNNYSDSRGSLRDPTLVRGANHDNTSCRGPDAPLYPRDTSPADFSRSRRSSVAKGAA